MSHKQMFIIGGAVVGYLFVTQFSNLPGFTQLANGFYSLGHGDGFSIQPTQ